MMDFERVQLLFRSRNEAMRVRREIRRKLVESEDGFVSVADLFHIAYMEIEPWMYTMGMYITGWCNLLDCKIVDRGDGYVLVMPPHGYCPTEFKDRRDKVVYKKEVIPLTAKFEPVDLKVPDALRYMIENRVTVYHHYDPKILQHKVILMYQDDTNHVFLNSVIRTRYDEHDPEADRAFIERKKEEFVNKVIEKYKEKEMEATNMSVSKKYHDLEKKIRDIGGSISFEYVNDFHLSRNPLVDVVIKIPGCSIDAIDINTAAIEKTATNSNPTRRGINDFLPPIVKIDTYNDRATKVTFADGTFTKAVCSDNDHFDLDVGITVCAMKRIFGKDGSRHYNNLIRYAHDVIVKNDNLKEEERKQKAEEKLKKRKAELKKAAKKLKAKEEYIDVQAQAIVRAHDILDDRNKEEGIGV